MLIIKTTITIIMIMALNMMMHTTTMIKTMIPPPTLRQNLNTAEIIKEPQEAGYEVVMVGNGVYDVPELATGDVGITIDTGTNGAAVKSAITTIIVVLNAQLLCRTKLD